MNQLLLDLESHLQHFIVGHTALATTQQHSHNSTPSPQRFLQRRFAYPDNPSAQTKQKQPW